MRSNALRMIFAISAVLLLAAMFVGALRPANAQGPDCAQTYVVKRGDYLVKIARQYSQDPKAYLEIFQATRTAAKSDRSFARLFIPHYIVAGQKLCIPASVVAQAPAPAGTTAVVTGTVTYLQRIALPPNALVTVQLVEPGGVAGPVVLERRFIYSAGRQVPIPFEIKYDPNQIKPDVGYGVQASITSGGQVTFRSTQPVPVITGGNPTSNVEIVVNPVEGGASEQPPAY